MFGSIINTMGSIANAGVSAAINTVTAPVKMASNALDIIDGLTEGELRTKAIMSLGEEVALSMTQAELIEWYKAN